jgi:hypothetical protein
MSVGQPRGPHGEVRTRAQESHEEALAVIAELFLQNAALRRLAHAKLDDWLDRFVTLPNPQYEWELRERGLL